MKKFNFKKALTIFIVCANMASFGNIGGAFAVKPKQSSKNNPTPTPNAPSKQVEENQQPPQDPAITKLIDDVNFFMAGTRSNNEYIIRELDGHDKDISFLTEALLNVKYTQETSQELIGDFNKVFSTRAEFKQFTNNHCVTTDRTFNSINNHLKRVDSELETLRVLLADKDKQTRKLENLVHNLMWTVTKNNKKLLPNQVCYVDRPTPVNNFTDIDPNNLSCPHSNPPSFAPSNNSSAISAASEPEIFVPLTTSYTLNEDDLDKSTTSSNELSDNNNNTYTPSAGETLDYYYTIEPSEDEWNPPSEGNCCLDPYLFCGEK